MEENELTIPFELNKFTQNILLKLLRKLGYLCKKIIRRTIDIIVALIGIIILIPLTLTVWLQNIKNKDYGKIFYTQERIGKNGKRFKMYKYRTMVENADEILKELLKDKEIRKDYEKYRKIKNDPRITKFGKTLRQTSLDEFPQFINILKGEMSIIGPRPYMVDEKEKMGEYYNYIVQHKPGLTGVFQISANPRIDFLDRLDMDVRYHYNKSMLMDLKIALITLLITLRRKSTFGTVGITTYDSIGYISQCISLFIKRIIDIIGSIVGIILLVPLTGIVYIGNIICKDKGPIFYSHERIGKNGKKFKMYKFRSMIVNADEILKEVLAKDENARKEWEANQKLENDPRITKMGKFLRKASLDEFPQFINVLKGEMSIVGPRAVVDGEIEKFGTYKEKVLSVRPGITGNWAANGRSNTTYEERVEMEVEYVDNFSIIQDIKILFKTVISVIKKEGAV